MTSFGLDSVLFKTQPGFYTLRIYQIDSECNMFVFWKYSEYLRRQWF